MAGSPLPFGLQAYKRANSFLPEVEMLNYYAEKDQTGAVSGGYVRIQRPGLTTRIKLPTLIRGYFQQDGVLNGREFAVSGSNLYNATTGALLGYVGSDGRRVEFAATYAGLYIVSANIVYFTDGTTVTQIASPDDRPFVSIDTINSYVVCFCPDGRWYWIEPASMTIDPLNFATAESSPDGGVAVRRVVDEIWFFGTKTTEPWQATGDPDAPFQRASGRVYDRGCRSRDTTVRFDNGIIWVGDDGIVYRTANVPQAVSTNGIEERITRATDQLSAFTFDTNGHKFYVLKIPGEGDFAYDAREGEWTRFASPGITSWRPWVGEGRICASSTDGTIWDMGDTTPGDDGVAFRRAASAIVALSGKPQRNPSVSISVGLAADAQFRLRWRDSDESFPEYWDEFELSAPVDDLRLRRMGQIRAPFRVFEVETTDLVLTSLWDASLGDAWD